MNGKPRGFILRTPLGARKEIFRAREVKFGLDQWTVFNDALILQLLTMGLPRTLGKCDR